MTNRRRGSRRILDQLAATRDAGRLASEGRARSAVSVARLHADVELHRQLADENFEGPCWDRFVEVLVEFAFPVLTTWIVSGAIRKHVAHNARVLLEAPPSPIMQEDAEDLALETIADALGPFRDRVLRANRWDPSRGRRSNDLVDRVLPPAVSRCLPALAHSPAQMEFLATSG